MQTLEGEKTNCPVCESPYSSTLFDVIQEDWKVTIARCLDCNHKYANPQPTENELSRLYSMGLTRWTNEESYLKNRERYFSFYSLLVQKQIKKGHSIYSILDVGCGTGLLAELLGNTFKLRSGGIDISPKDCSLAANRVNEVVCGNISSKKENIIFSQKYDLVIATDVFEHLTHLNIVMENIRNLTTTGGLLLIDTGDIGRMGAILGGRRNPFLSDKGHINYFSRRTMELMLTRNGYKILELHDENEIPSTKNVPLWTRLKRSTTSSPNMIVVAQKVKE